MLPEKCAVLSHLVRLKKFHLVILMVLNEAMNHQLIRQSGTRAGGLCL
jgi:hypothetical protein